MKGDKGFTLIELAIAICIIAIMLVFATTSAVSYRKDTVVSATVSYIADWKKAMRRYYAMYSSYPAAISTNGFNQNYLNNTPPADIGFVNYIPNATQGSCVNEPAIVIDMRDGDTLQRLSSELSSRGFRICGTSGTQITVSVKQ